MMAINLMLIFKRDHLVFTIVLLIIHKKTRLKSEFFYGFNALHRLIDFVFPFEEYNWNTTEKHNT
jgi:type IV secretory pathway VirB3-like protein